ncbi:hypothetical protein GCM10020331_030240 [Ectobacillus funiculus]
MEERKVQDTHKRSLRDLRISVTDRCNFRCIYCMPIEEFGPNHCFMSREQLLTFEEITRLAKQFVRLGVEKNSLNWRRAAPSQGFTCAHRDACSN